MTRRRVNPAAFGATYAVLMAAHDLSDHVIQTDAQATNKARAMRQMWMPAMAGHVGSYTAVQVLALGALRALAGVRPSWRRTLAAVAFSAGTHALLDRRWPVIAVLRATGSQNFAKPVVRTTGDVRGVAGAPAIVDAVGPLPLHGPYLADQALHHAALAIAAAVIAGGRR